MGWSPPAASLEEEKEPEKGTENNSFERQKGTRAFFMAVKQSSVR